METKRKALGMGLEELFSNEKIDFNSFEEEIVKNVSDKDIVNIPLKDIRSNPYQPRKTFDEKALLELAQSINEHGVVQPIIVKKSIKGYELIAGERRTRASKIAGLETIPAIIRDFNDNEMMEIALVENIQRENLNPIEEANAYVTIIQNTGMTQEEIARKFGKSRSYLTNMIGLTRLPDYVKDKVINKDITMAHARSLSKLESQDQMIDLCNQIIKLNMNVHDLEKLISNNDYEKKNKLVKHIVKTNYTIYENVMREKIGTRVKISNNKIEIPFDSEKDLERILEIINIDLERD